MKTLAIAIASMSLIESAIAQPAIQHIISTQPNGKSYAETRAFTDLATCQSLMTKNLLTAARLGYETKSNSALPMSAWYRDPKTGIAITQSCNTDKVFDPAPVHPTASFPSPVGVGEFPPPVKVSCPRPGPRTAVLVTFGQSNAANSGEGRYTSSSKVVVHHEDACYQGSDPLNGATGSDGSPWGRLGDILIDRGVYDHVIIVALGAGGTFIKHWTPGADHGHHTELIRRVRSLIAKGYAPTAFLWHQGEADAAMQGVTGAAYKASFNAMYDSLHAVGGDAPIYVAVATICAVRWIRPLPDLPMLHLGPDQLILQAHQAQIVRSAQTELASESGGKVRSGPDTDTIGPEFRFDGCHFSRRGLDIHAKLWFEALIR